MSETSPLTYKFFLFLTLYDNGTIFAPAILDIKDEDLRDRFMMVCIFTLHFVSFQIITALVV
jgi:hypothetical protein